MATSAEMTHLLLGLIVVLLLENAVTADTQCTKQSSSRLQINVTSEMNEARQRFLTVETESTGRESEPLAMAVDHWARLCDGTETVGVKLIAAASTVDLKEPPVTVDNYTVTEINVKNSTTRPEFPCRLDYTLVPDVGCYKGNPTGLTWKQAQRSCEADGAHLAVPDTQQELDQLGVIALSLRLGSWVGVHKVDGKWVTVGGGILQSTFTPRKSFGPGDCAIALPSGLNEYSCTRTPTFICEQP